MSSRSTFTARKAIHQCRLCAWLNKTRGVNWGMFQEAVVWLAAVLTPSCFLEMDYLLLVGKVIIRMHFLVLLFFFSLSLQGEHVRLTVTLCSRHWDRFSHVCCLGKATDFGIWSKQYTIPVVYFWHFDIAKLRIKDLQPLCTIEGHITWSKKHFNSLQNLSFVRIFSDYYEENFILSRYFFFLIMVAAVGERRRRAAHEL